MSSILSRIFKRKGSRGRKAVSRSYLSQRKSSKERSQELERAVESCDALAMLKKRTPRRVPKDDKEKIKLFKKWCAEVGIEYHPDVKIQREGCCNGLGVIATADINEGECVATVPITSVLACVNSDIRELVRENEGSLTSSWIPLLLTLAYEYSCKSCSKWYPYLSIVPNDLSPMPMMWAESVRETLLEGTAINSWVGNDLANIERDYQTVVAPIVAKYPSVFKAGMQDIEMYKKYVGYVMSYSFTDEKAGLLGKTMLVPFVDIINHSSYNNVKLTFHPQHLKLIAVKHISKGEEVMNTYGTHSNASLLHMYGFTEEDNAHVEAVIQCEVVKQVFFQCFSNPAHWDALLDLDVVEEEYSVGFDGQPHQDLLILTHLLCSNAKSTKKLVQCLEPDSLQSLDDCSEVELAFLTRLAECCLEQYPEDVSTATPVTCYGNTQNEMNAWRVVLGQQESLKALRALTTQ